MRCLTNDLLLYCTFKYISHSQHRRYVAVPIEVDEVNIGVDRSVSDFIHSPHGVAPLGIEHLTGVNGMLYKLIS